MALEEVRKRNAERRQIMQSRSTGIFIKFVNDQDTMVVKLVPPFEGFDRKVKDMQGRKRLKQHYRMHVLGDLSFNTGHPLSNSRIELSVDDVRNLKDNDAKILTSPESITKGVQREIEKGHSILQIRRDGDPKDTSTTYSVLYAMQIDDEEWKKLLPRISKEELAELQSEEKFNEISDAELEALENLGVRED